MALITYAGLVLGVYIGDEVPLTTAVGTYRGAATKRIEKTAINNIMHMCNIKINTFNLTSFYMSSWA